ncbi:unnamed protein product, partial [Allacma fusca]
MLAVADMQVNCMFFNILAQMNLVPFGFDLSSGIYERKSKLRRLLYKGQVLVTG